MITGQFVLMQHAVCDVNLVAVHIKLKLLGTKLHPPPPPSLRALSVFSPSKTISSGTGGTCKYHHQITITNVLLQTVYTTCTAEYPGNSQRVHARSRPYTGVAPLHDAGHSPEGLLKNMVCQCQPQTTVCGG